MICDLLLNRRKDDGDWVASAMLIHSVKHEFRLFAETNLVHEADERRFESPLTEEEKRPEVDSRIDNLTLEPMEVQNADPTENLSPCDMDISSPD